MQAKKPFRRVAGMLLIVVIAVLVYPLRGGKSLRDATGDEIVQQIPYVLDILSARHPFKVGIALSVLNPQGSVDQLAEDYVRSSLNQRDMGVLDCYVTYYVIAFDQDDVRRAMADTLEKKLGLV
jgi:hypothetical protein